MMKPTVTIGVCVKNGEDSIQDAIDSIINQDFPHERMEVIFVDDGSEDRTLSIILDCVSRMDMQVKVHHQEWKGVAAARNVVVDKACGDYIVWVDCDLVLSRDFVRKLVELMERHPSVGIAKAKYNASCKGNLVGILEEERRLKYVDYNYEGKPQTRWIGLGGSIYRVQAIRQVGGFDENLDSGGEDMDAQCRIEATGWTLYITNAMFSDYGSEMTWNDLWNKFFKFGYSLHYILHKHRGVQCLPIMLPPVAFFLGLFRALAIYRLTHRKIFFLLPFQYVFKMSAWYFGFIGAHLNSYEPRA